MNRRSNEGDVRVRRALISSWRKEEAVELARRLAVLEVKLVASGGTADAIASAGLSVERLSAATGFEDLLGGRVKTLHPAVHAAVLARRDVASDVDDLKRIGVEPVDLVAVDLYPFPADSAEVGVSIAVELIDVGGVTLIRGAAKNFRHVAVLCRAEQFKDAEAELEASGGWIGLERRQELAAEAFRFTCAYDRYIAERLAEVEAGKALPESRALFLTRHFELRYGENPHQPGAFYIPTGSRPAGIAAILQHSGKKLSYNNLLDLDIALRMPREFEAPAATILKHTTPCGFGVGETLREAFESARSTDPQSAFGGVVGFNRAVDAQTAAAIREGFMEVVVAPGFEPDALNLLKKSKNLRIIEFAGEPLESEQDIRSVWGGILIQGHDRGFPELDGLKVVTERQPGEWQLGAMRLAWKVVRYVKSNAVVIADDRHTIGIGAGQMSRVDAARIAVWKAGQAGLPIEGSVAASDAFFPFRDGVDVLVDAGVSAIIQPGGSVRDPEVIAAADERGISMVFTGVRHFRH